MFTENAIKELEKVLIENPNKKLEGNNKKWNLYQLKKQ
jgi:hypothetical protein